MLWRQNWLALLRPKETARSKSASSFTFAARASMVSLSSHQRSSCHRSRTLPSRSLTPLWAASTSLMPSIPSRFATTKRVIWLSRSTASGSALPPVPCCGSAFQQCSHVWVSQCSSPRSSESKRVWTTLRGSPKDSLSSDVSFRSCAPAPLGSHGRELVLEEKQVWPVYRLDRHNDNRPPTPWLQCSVDRNPSAQRIRPFRKDSHSDKDSWTSKKFYMSLESSVGPVVSSCGSRLSTRPSGPPSCNTVNPKKLNAGQVRVNGPPTCSLLHASQLRCAGSGHCCWVYLRQAVSFKWVHGGPLATESFKKTPCSPHRRLSLGDGRHHLH